MNNIDMIRQDFRSSCQKSILILTSITPFMIIGYIAFVVQQL